MTIKYCECCNVQLQRRQWDTGFCDHCAEVLNVRWCNVCENELAMDGDDICETCWVAMANEMEGYYTHDYDDEKLEDEDQQ